MSPRQTRRRNVMDVMIVCCAGLDVHKDSIEACVRRIDKDGKLQQQNRRWGTMTRELESMAEWLSREAVTHIAMESTGVYWKPIFNILEKHFQVLLVNARSIKHVPGRKTDQKDSQWMLRLLYDQLLSVESFLSKLDEKIEQLTRPQQPVVEKLDQIPGIDRRVAEVLLAEIGTDMSPFPSSAHLTSWAGLCPGNNESAGKKKSGKTTKGSRWLRQALVQAAWAASRKKDSYFQAHGRNLMRREAKNAAWWRWPIPCWLLSTTCSRKIETTWTWVQNSWIKSAPSI